MLLDLTNLEKALLNLKKAICRTQQEPNDEELRDSVIQRFEYSYELSWKMLKRRLEIDLPTPSNIDLMGFKELIREGAERGFIENPESWFEYRHQRNITAHTYHELKAKQVYQTALLFIEDANNLLQQLKQRNQ